MIRLLSTLNYAPEQKLGEEDTIILPLLKEQGIVHAISIGPGSQNMAGAYNHASDDLDTRENTFLTKNHLESLTMSYFSTVPEEDSPIIYDLITPNISKLAVRVPADVIFTKLTNTPLIHKPADCPTAVILAKNDYSLILGLAHLGRPQVNKKVAERMVDHLIKSHKVKPQDIFVGISPSIGPRNYFLKAKDQEKYHFIDEDYWDKFSHEDLLENETIIRIDVLGKILSVLHSKGIPDQNIEAYGHEAPVDTFDLARQIPPLAFSHRYARSTNQPLKNGRMVVVAQL